MTNIGTIILLLVCVGIGYVVEPIFFSSSNRSKNPKQTEATAKGKATDTNSQPAPVAPAPAPVAPPKSTIQIDLSKVTKADFPEKVELKAPLVISNPEFGSISLKKGGKVIPVRLEGNKLVVRPTLVNVESTIDVDHTNFKELALPKMLERLQNAVASTPEPTPPTPEPAPTPPTPEPDPEPTKLDAAAIVTLMKSSVQAGKVTEFKGDQVTSWKAGEDMEFDGDTYQTGLVTFKAETILGVQEHDAIALIEDGKIYKWMWAKTKLEMR